MDLNVIQIDPKVIKPTNAIQTVRSRPQYKSDKISVVALFQKTQFILLHLIEKTLPRINFAVLNRKEISTAALFRI